MDRIAPIDLARVTGAIGPVQHPRGHAAARHLKADAFTPMFSALGAGWRMFGQFAPDVVKTMAVAAQWRHDVVVKTFFGENAEQKALHDGYVRAFYEDFAPP